jgi:hypothetical protein
MSPPSRVSQVLKIVALVFATVFVLAASCVGYIGYRAHDAAKSMNDFCNSVALGQPSAGLAARARARGLDVQELPSRQDPGAAAGGTLRCTKGVFLAQHICEVEHSAGQVTRVESMFVD